MAECLLQLSNICAEASIFDGKNIDVLKKENYYA